MFNDELVLQQLRYTGMLATVEIRQSGYNYRLTFEVNIQAHSFYMCVLKGTLLRYDRPDTTTD